MDKLIFVNLPVKDLEETRNFFEALGFIFDRQFSDEKAICMVINESAYIMFLKEDFFRTFTSRSVADARKSTEVLTAISAESKKRVDEIIAKAEKLGGEEIGSPQEHEHMYARCFSDPDGHIWEVLWMHHR